MYRLEKLHGQEPLLPFSARTLLLRQGAEQWLNWYVLEAFIQIDWWGFIDFLVDLSGIKLTDITLNQYHISNLDILYRMILLWILPMISYRISMINIDTVVNGYYRNASIRTSSPIFGMGLMSVIVGL